MNSITSMSDILNLTGPEFLKFYVVTGIILLILAGLLRRFVRLPFDALRPAPPLNPFDIAYLQGKERRAVEAAVASLVKERLIQVSSADGMAHATGVLVGKPAPIVEAVHAKVLAKGAKGLAIRSLMTSAPSGACRYSEEKLATYGLLIDWGSALAIRATTALMLFALAGLGAAKIQIGLARERPVEILVFLTVLTCLIALVFLFTGPHRSRRGDAVLKNIVEQSSALRTTASSGGALLTSDLALAAALFGVGNLATPGLEDLRAAQQRYLGNSGTSCGSSSSCGGSSCGGGCGGGGCGGCGG